ncbi:MAG TPA: TolC family protein [Kiritimatiellia bacterium]|nr:TolC family protein [Kiritimatiellia bacterium]HRZ12320.1 TolC family protein [Kiritimatiellia bacterium]HSA17922.1 TolC family protein [Kiritimatiellia bacterium]
MRAKCALLFLALGPAGFAATEPPEPVCADAIVAQALAYSLRLKSAEQDVRAAAASLAQAGAQGLPTVSAEARAAHYEGLKETALSPTMIIPEIPDRYGAVIGVSQPLYTGGRVSSLKQAAALQSDAARQALAGTESDVVLEALSSYWSWSRAFFALRALRASVDRMEAHARDMKNMNEAGLATDNDRLSTEVLLERTRLQRTEAERNEALARAKLDFLTGASLPSNAAADEAAASPAADPAPESVLLEMAATNRPEVRAAALEARSAAKAVRAARAGYGPELALSARYEQARPNTLIFPPEDEWQDDAFVGVVASWALFDSGLTRGRVLEARARAEQADLRRRQAEDRVALEVRQARVALANAGERAVVAGRARDSAALNLQSATDLWQNGLARHADVLDAHAQLTDAEFALVSARADAVVARAALDHAVGILAAPKP